MPFGAHETMEVHEILTEKLNMISHFNLYASQTKNPELRNMITRHQQEEIKSYDAIVAYTHDYTQFTPVPPNTSVNHVMPEDIQYGLNNPSMLAPETNAVLNEYEVASAMLIAHKNGAMNGVRASLEIADPNLRQMLMNGAINCINQAYEVFLFMNQQGMYQIPQIKDHTAKTFLHSFQPVGESVKAQHSDQAGQKQGQGQSIMSYMQNQQMPMSQQMSPQNMGHHMQMGQGTPAAGGAMGQNMGSGRQQQTSFGQMGNPGMMQSRVQGNMPQYRANQQYNH
ncbi:spore coat protein [Mesobacillus foraminis]|uniref:Spore coat protein CotF n=1 Tax=Mesobacillus foraminis TaxID=279826 RepID=A0A4R2B8M4_9BACI|nr:spore coat protein [Mesobacillus foraminis]TCN22625.1 spore coat protein CotF [Mesobacillus foraminis]